jgi:hypothetical protein
MAKRIFHVPNWTPTATADSPTTLVSGSYMGLQGGSTTQLIDVLEMMVTGFAGASSPTILQMARVSAVEATPTALANPASDGPAHPSTAALAAPPVSFTAAATGPARSSATTDARLDMGVNAFGGIKRWVAAPGAQWTILGNAASVGCSVLSAYTGGTVGAISAHIEYEPY